MKKNSKYIEIFEIIEEFFDYYAKAEDNIVKQIINEAEENRIPLNLDTYDIYSIFEKLRLLTGYSQKITSDNTIFTAHHDKMYSILQRYNYNTKNDLKITIRELITQYNLEDENNDYYKDSYICYSYGYGVKGYDNVTDLNYNSPYLYITDKSGYTFTIIDLKNYDMASDKLNISSISDIIKDSGDNKCHEYTAKIASVLPNADSITAACPRFFKGNYYLHSYTEYNDYVIDLTLGIMMPKDDYYLLMEPIELARTKNKYIDVKKQEIEKMISVLPEYYDSISDWAYVLYIAYLNILNNPEVLKSSDLESIIKNTNF